MLRSLALGSVLAGLVACGGVSSVDDSRAAVDGVAGAQDSAGAAGASHEPETATGGSAARASRQTGGEQATGGRSATGGEPASTGGRATGGSTGGQIQATGGTTLGQDEPAGAAGSAEAEASGSAGASAVAPTGGTGTGGHAATGGNAATGGQTDTGGSPSTGGATVDRCSGVGSEKDGLCVGSQLIECTDGADAKVVLQFPGYSKAELEAATVSECIGASWGTVDKCSSEGSVGEPPHCIEVVGQEWGCLGEDPPLGPGPTDFPGLEILTVACSYGTDEPPHNWLLVEYSLPL